jgi:hypothetical protein
MHYHVHYLHYVNGGEYWVARAFDTREDAQRFIDDNALVFPLPGPPYITEPVLKGAKPDARWYDMSTSSER